MCKLGCEFLLIVNGLELLNAEPNSDFGWVHYIYLQANNFGKIMNSPELISKTFITKSLSSPVKKKYNVKIFSGFQ